MMQVVFYSSTVQQTACDRCLEGSSLVSRSLCHPIALPFSVVLALVYSLPHGFVARFVWDRFLCFLNGCHHFGPHEEIERNYARWKHRTL